MKFYIFLFFSCIFILSGEDSNNSIDKKEIVSSEISKLTYQYRILRTNKNPNQRKWNSKLHKVMDQIKKSDWKKTNISTVLKLLGKPDLDKKSENYENLKSLTNTRNDEEIIIYLWRGNHDFLYFVYSEKNNRIIKVDWWMAFE